MDKILGVLAEFCEAVANRAFKRFEISGKKDVQSKAPFSRKTNFYIWVYCKFKSLGYRFITPTPSHLNTAVKHR